MNQPRLQKPEPLEGIVRSLGSGLILVDANGETVWMDEKTRRGTDGELQRLDFPMRHDEHAIDCFLTTVEVAINGEPRKLCVVQANGSEAVARHAFHNLIDDAVRDVMSDSSWLTRPLTEKLKAWCQVARPSGRTAGLDLLTAREREILALICEGRSDAEMGTMLNLSQNTVRNHIASLFRKIGVNRRGAAIIWARERGITRHDALAFGSRKRRGHKQDSTDS